MIEKLSERDFGRGPINSMDVNTKYVAIAQSSVNSNQGRISVLDATDLTVDVIIVNGTSYYGNIGETVKIEEHVLQPNDIEMH